MRMCDVITSCTKCHAQDLLHTSLHLPALLNRGIRLPEQHKVANQSFKKKSCFLQGPLLQAPRWDTIFGVAAAFCIRSQATPLFSGMPCSAAQPHQQLMHNSPACKHSHKNHSATQLQRCSNYTSVPPNATHPPPCITSSLHKQGKLSSACCSHLFRTTTSLLVANMARHHITTPAHNF